MAQKRSRAAFEADLQAQQSPYVFFGTPLPPLDPHSRDDGSYVPVWKQEVTDERGRKRLHGAFTGGFSAGYFNTVGSKEGWTPQTFVSSRANRAKAVQKAEDFMDEEDLADADEAKVLETKDSFLGFGSTEKEVGGKGPFMDLLRPQGDTMGIKLLRKMGWTEGQGIGDGKWKVRAREHHDPGGIDQGVSSNQTPSKIISFVRKTDTKGLGLGLEGVLESGGRPNRFSNQHTTSKSKATKAKPKTGFGVGILNDTGSDDEDPYDLGPRLSYSRVASDKFKKKKAESGLVTSSSNPLLASRPMFVKKIASTSDFRRCYDGKLPIDGFVLSSQGPVTQDRKFKPPTIPEGWTSVKTALKLEGASAYHTTADLAKASALDPSARAAMLGEAMLPGQSVFDFLSPAARDKLAAATNNPNLPAGRYQPSVLPPTPPEESLIPALDAVTAKSALQRSTGSFVPYSDNPGKLSRYRAFLTYRSEPHDTSANPPPRCSPHTHQKDFLSELQEFANAAAIFKPMSGSMANRFTSSGSASAGQSSASKDEDGKEIPLLSRPSKQLAPEEEAAKIDMYGPLTRKTVAFYPTRLLCKRFGVTAPLHVQPEPENGAVATSSGSGVGKKGSATDIHSGFGNRFTSGGVQSAEDERGLRKNKLEIVGRRDLEEMRKAAGLPALGEVVKRKDRETTVDPNRNEALEAERPSEQTFKEIFANDD